MHGVGERFAARLKLGPRKWLVAHDPVLILQADAPDAVRRTLTDVEQLTRDRGLHAIGFVTYEAGAAFGLPVHDTHRAGVPLAWFTERRQVSTKRQSSFPASLAFCLNKNLRFCNA